MQSCIPDVIKKLRSHPDFWDIADSNQLREEAEDLTDPDKIMSRFFSSILYYPAYEGIMGQEGDWSDELITTHERQERRIHHIEGVAKFQIKLLLRYVSNQASTVTTVAGKLASILRMEYGPLHAALLINNEVLLEWNSSSLVIPRFVDPCSMGAQPVLVSATVTDHHRPQRQLSKPVDQYDEIELIFDAVSQKVDLLQKIAKVISLYNSCYDYHVIFRNCQNFVLDVLEAIGCNSKPQFGGNLKNYFTYLKQNGCIKRDFETHQQLNDYVSRHHTELAQEDMEYLLAQYFLFHMERVTESGNLEDWRCKDGDCLMDFLEAKIDEKQLIVKKFLHQATPKRQTCAS